MPFSKVHNNISVWGHNCAREQNTLPSPGLPYANFRYLARSTRNDRLFLQIAYLIRPAGVERQGEQRVMLVDPSFPLYRFSVSQEHP